MSETNLSDLSIEELNERREQLGDTVGTDHYDEKLSERERRRAKEAELLDMKIKLEEAKSRGLDDLTVDRIETQLAELAEELETGPRAQLAAETGFDRSSIARLSPGQAETALAKLEAIEHIQDAPETSVTSSEAALEENRAELEDLLAGGDAEAAALESAYLSDEAGEEIGVALLESDDDGAAGVDEDTTPSRTGPSPQEELAEATGLSREEADVYSDRKARTALGLYKDLEAMAGIPHDGAQEKFEEKSEELAELAIDDAAHKAALSVPDGGA